MSRNADKESVLPAMNRDGTRRWIRPRLAPGRFLSRRRFVAYALIVLFVSLPFLRIGGRPAMLIDVTSAELSLFGMVFRPSDGFLLMLLGLTVVTTVLLVTALFGRVWCGWGCPQTVYLEHVFRPLERWIEGSVGQQKAMDKKNWPTGRRIVGWSIFVALSFVVANVFLSYFVGTDRLLHWITTSPAKHPGGFATVMIVTGLMFADFAYFREQVCIIACPYGRLQSTLLDTQSLIVAYDAGRGEPRGAVRHKLPMLAEAPLVQNVAHNAGAVSLAGGVKQGSCIDCNACVAVCPTGIDIRQGLQLECVGCAQCIDACDTVMDKVHQPRGLIRYTSQDQLAGKTNVWDAGIGMAQTPLMNAAQLREWVAAGQEIGVHTRHHVRLPQLDEATSRVEITQCKAELQDMLGSPVNHFCYPYGEFTPIHTEIAREAGFHTTTTTQRSRVQSGEDMMLLPRVRVVNNTVLPALWQKVATGYEDRRRL